MSATQPFAVIGGGGGTATVSAAELQTAIENAGAVNYEPIYSGDAAQNVAPVVTNPKVNYRRKKVLTDGTVEDWSFATGAWVRTGVTAGGGPASISGNFIAEVSTNAALDALNDTDATVAIEDGDLAVLSADAADSGKNRVAGLYKATGGVFPLAPIIPKGVTTEDREDTRGFLTVDGPLPTVGVGEPALNDGDEFLSLADGLTIGGFTLNTGDALRFNSTGDGSADSHWTKQTASDPLSPIEYSTTALAGPAATGKFIGVNPTTNTIIAYRDAADQWQPITQSSVNPEIVSTNTAGTAAIIGAAPPADALLLWNTETDQVTHHVVAGAWDAVVGGTVDTRGFRGVLNPAGGTIALPTAATAVIRPGDALQDGDRWIVESAGTVGTEVFTADQVPAEFIVKSNNGAAQADWIADKKGTDTTLYRGAMTAGNGLPVPTVRAGEAWSAGESMVAQDNGDYGGISITNAPSVILFTGAGDGTDPSHFVVLGDTAPSAIRRLSVTSPDAAFGFVKQQSPLQSEIQTYFDNPANEAAVDGVVEVVVNTTPDGYVWVFSVLGGIVGDRDLRYQPPITGNINTDLLPQSEFNTDDPLRFNGVDYRLSAVGLWEPVSGGAGGGGATPATLLGLSDTDGAFQPNTIWQTNAAGTSAEQTNILDGGTI